MRLTDAARPIFARHETFQPRYGWFRKGYAAAGEDPLTFARPDAPTRLGVGKNMARSIRFWALAAKLVCAAPGPRSSAVTPTRLGRALFGDEGWDPYMEDPGTLWLLHWLLLAPPSMLPVWWLAFHGIEAVEFSDDTLSADSQRQLELATWGAPNPSSIRKDVGVLLRSYSVAPRERNRPAEAAWDCPLRELALITPAVAAGRYRFRHGPKPDLPGVIVAYAALDWAARCDLPGRSVTVDRLAAEPGSVGRTFKLSGDDLLAALEHAAHGVEHITMTTSAGAAQLTWAGDAAEVAPLLLDAYYGTNTAADSNLHAGLAGDEAAAAPSALIAR